MRMTKADLENMVAALRQSNLELATRVEQLEFQLTQDSGLAELAFADECLYQAGEIINRRGGSIVRKERYIKGLHAKLREQATEIAALNARLAKAIQLYQDSKPAPQAQGDTTRTGAPTTQVKCSSCGKLLSAAEVSFCRRQGLHMACREHNNAEFRAKKAARLAATQ